jgi:hypothetical protein
MHRGAISSIQGTPVAVTDSSHPDVIEKQYNYLIDADFNADNCTVVAFIYDIETHEILQVAESKVITPSTR